MTTKKSIYEERANELVKAIDIAEQVVSESSTLPASIKEPLLFFSSNTRKLALNPEPQFRKVASLKYLEHDFLIYWNETAGPDSDKFWQLIASAGLQFKKKDAIQDALRRNKIKNIHEYDYVIDNIVVAQQTGSINTEQVIQLNTLIAEFEARNKSKNKSR